MDRKREIIQIIETMAGKYSAYEIFTDWIRALSLGNAGLINYAATGSSNGLIHAMNVIKGLPSAQPEIIRCKDCKHADEHCRCFYVTWWNSPNDFCSRAKRREE